MGHSSSAYSFDEVYPSGSVTAASTITSCQPQNTKLSPGKRKAKLPP